MDYLWLKWIHILSAIVLFGTGLGTAFFKYSTDRSGDVRAIAVVMRIVVLADWLFTTPAVIVQPVTGLALAHLAGFALSATWLWASLGLYALAGACWLPVLWLQLRMRSDAASAARNGTPLPERYARDRRAWVALGVPAFAAMVGVVWLMVFKPA